MAEPDVVVTNAHVVAGEQDTTVEVGGRSTRPARYSRSPSTRPTTSRCCVFAGLGAPPLSLVTDPPSGEPGRSSAIRRTGRSTSSPARIGRTQTVLTQDAYGQGPVSRLLTPLRGLVRPGNSGGPLVDGDGRVMTTVFAGTVGGGPARRLRSRQCDGCDRAGRADAPARAGAQVSRDHARRGESPPRLTEWPAPTLAARDPAPGTRYAERHEQDAGDRREALRGAGLGARAARAPSRSRRAGWRVPSM